MNKTIEFYKQRLEKSEQSLRNLGCEKCAKCGIFMDKEYIRQGLCGECKYD